MALIQPSLEDYAHLLVQAAPELEDQLVRELCEGSLYDFLKEAWSSFDPAPFVGGWHLQAIAEHLEAVNNGQIRKLLINIRPRSGKTGLVAVAWPTWTWALQQDPRFPLRGPGVRFLCGSYGANKAQEDGVTARRLIGSSWYQKLWGDRVKICFPENQYIQTESGARCIGLFVRDKDTTRVWSWSEERQCAELRSVVGWHINPGAALIRLVFDSGLEVVCTGDHTFRLSDGGYLAAGDMPVGTSLPVSNHRSLRSFNPGFVRLVRVELAGYAAETFCITVEGNNNLFVGDNQAIVASNCRDRDNQERYDTEAGGSRINTGIPESLGKGGMIRILDDPHKTDEVESEKIREGVLRAYKEIWSTRSNDPNKGAEVMIMQRQAENDLSGYWLETGGPETVHLCIPAWHEDDRRCQTYVKGHLFWEDPRETDGESFWPERYAPSQRIVDEALGPFGFSGQIQQRPEPRGGGIIRREWWQPWPPDDSIEKWTNQVGQVTYPPWELVLGYLDTAFTKKETNDWCAMTRWGVFGDSAGRPRAMLCGAWRERLNFRELIQKVRDTCRAGRIDILVIENKAGGNWVREELMKELQDGEFTIVLDTPTVDKVARAHAVVPLFVDKMVHAPFMHEHGVWRSWAEMAISEIEKFPMGRHDDLVDSAVGALGYLRRNDLIKLAVEHDEDEREKKIFRGNQGGVASLYEVN